MSESGIRGREFLLVRVLSTRKAARMYRVFRGLQDATKTHSSPPKQRGPRCHQEGQVGAYRTRPLVAKGVSHSATGAATDTPSARPLGGQGRIALSHRSGPLVCVVCVCDPTRPRPFVCVCVCVCVTRRALALAPPNRRTLCSESPVISVTPLSHVAQSLCRRGRRIRAHARARVQRTQAALAGLRPPGEL